MSNCSGTDPKVETKYITKTDTIEIVRDSIVEHTKVKYINYTDTFYIKNKDTVFVLVPVEHKEYSDIIKKDSTETKIDIKYHGFAADIDYVNLEHKYNKEITTITLPPKKWTIGVTFGPYIGVGVHGNMQQGTFGWGPEVGIGVSFGVLRNFNLNRK